MRRTCMHRESSEILVTLVESIAWRFRERQGKGKGGKRGFACSIILVIVSAAFDRVDRRKIWGFAMRTDISQLRIMPSQNSDSPYYC